MKKIVVSVMVIGLSVIVIACSGKSAPTAPAVSAPAPAPVSVPTQESPATAALTPGNAYICPMHPEVTSGSPGKCPKCEMNLITMEEYHKQTPNASNTMTHEGHSGHGGN